MNINEKFSALEQRRDALEQELREIQKRIDLITEMLSDIKQGRANMAELDREFFEED